MFKITEYVPASKIWSTATDYTDNGAKSGLVCGYNIEVVTAEGKVTWLSCEFIHGEPEEHFNNDFYIWAFEEHGWKPTGRICFRGYGEEVWDDYEREMVIHCIVP